jgi:hypothetical protein
MWELYKLTLGYSDTTAIVMGEWVLRETPDEPIRLVDA